MSLTKIEWATMSWNPVTGCTPVSAACDHCYAARMAKRLRGRYGYPADEPFRVTLHPERLEEPLHWKKPRRVFVVSMGDLFHTDVHRDDILRVWMTMERCQQHTFLVLTKRAERMQRLLSEWMWPALQLATCLRPGVWPLPNVWLGVTAENQATADERIPLLLQTPAAKRFVSCEPLLGRIYLDGRNQVADEVYYNFLKGETGPSCQHRSIKPTETPHLDWVIVGGETGPGARPMHPQWGRSLLEQCKFAGIPFFWKSWGDWAPVTPLFEGRDEAAEDGRGELEAVDSAGHIWRVGDGQPSDPRTWLMEKVGKKAAGRLLDGREWNEFPETKA